MQTPLQNSSNADHLVSLNRALGYAYRDAHREPDAVISFGMAIAMEEQDGAPPAVLASDHVGLAECYITLRDFNEAWRHLDAAMKLSRDVRDPLTEAHAVADLAWLAAIQGQTPEAIQLLNQSIALFKSQDAGGKDVESLAIVENNLGYLYAQTSQNQDAEAVLTDALGRFRSLNDERGEDAASGTLELAYTMGGDSEKAGQIALAHPNSRLVCLQRYPFLASSSRCAPNMGGDDLTAAAERQVEKLKAELDQLESAGRSSAASAAPAASWQPLADSEASAPDSGPQTSASAAAQPAASAEESMNAAIERQKEAAERAAEERERQLQASQAARQEAQAPEPVASAEPPPPPPPSSQPASDSAAPASMPDSAPASSAAAEAPPEAPASSAAAEAPPEAQASSVAAEAQTEAQAPVESVAASAEGPQSAGSPGLPAAPPEALSSIERYPNIEAPDSVVMGQEIAVQVSLTTDQISPETRILSGQQSGGRLQLAMAANEQQWTMTVNLTAPNLEFSRGSNTQDIVVSRNGDSTIALFYLRAKEISAPRQDTRILATLWHDGTFIARIGRPVTILAARQARVSAAPEIPIVAANLQATPAARPPLPTAISFDPAAAPPDLTIVESRIGQVLRLTFQSRYGFAEADIANPDDLHRWVNAHYAHMAARERGLTPEEPSSSPENRDSDYLNGFGSEFYDKYAPQQFKDLYWKLYDTLGSKFTTIQILSDDPSLPWELLRPARADGRGRQQFLGLRYQIARWPLGQSGTRPPVQQIQVDKLAVIAPSYPGQRALPGAGEEMRSLAQIQGYVQVPPNYDGVRSLASHLPEGIIHFAGHGAVLDNNGVPTYVILLEDGRQIEPATWEDLAGSANSVHPLYFFNACEVGQSRRFMNDVDGWAPAVLAAGGAGYIGALWPVGDSTAAKFAAAFYSRVQQQTQPGHAANVARLLTETRKDVFAATADPTALAYVFYGDPLLDLAR